MIQNAAHGNMTHTPDGEREPQGVTRIWGHSHNDEMHRKDAFVSRLLLLY